MVKLAGGRRCGDDKNRTGNGALAAACRRIPHGQVAFAFTLGQVCGRTALVQADGLHTAQSDHQLCFFLDRISYGPGCHRSVGLENNHRAVRFNTDSSTGIISIVSAAVDRLSIPHQQEGTVYRFGHGDGLSLLCRLLFFSLRAGGSRSKYVYRPIREGRDVRHSGRVMVRNAPHNEHAGRLAGVNVEPGGVYAAYNILTVSILIQVCLVRRCHHGPAFIGRIQLTVTSNNFCITVIGVDLHNVYNCLGSSFQIVCGDHTLRNVRSNCIIFDRGNNIICSLNC